MNKPLLFAACSFLLAFTASATTKLVPVGKAWAQNSINANILRHNSVVSHEGTQYVAYYDEDGTVILAKRSLDSESWDIRKTRFSGKVRDAHNVISIMVDGDGYLHLSWDHHKNPLRYIRSVAPGSLDLSDPMPMTGLKEENVTYPEFYKLPNGNLLFLYRDGGSGRGNLMMNHYDTQEKTWAQYHDSLLDGEGERNAYWQMCADEMGRLHLSWVWRETPDVASNHDMGYAVSEDEGLTWKRSTGESYQLPITVSNSEYAARIPQSHELINSTSICADSQGRPYIATYFRTEGSQVPQYQLIYHDGEQWQQTQISNRQTPFSLSGGGTKRIPISRPHIIADSTGETTKAYLLFRDIERGNKVSLAVCEDLKRPKWNMSDLSDFSVDLWEPSYDTELWKQSRQLHIYVQRVEQGDSETTHALEPQTVSILEWNPGQGIE